MIAKAIYPGTFDPITLGHIDVIKRATRVFGHVVVAIANNTQKTPYFSTEDRMAMLKESTQDMDNVEVVSFDGLVTEYAQQNDIKVLIRGLRMVSDFEYEFQMALTNRRLAQEIETVFLMPSEGHSFLSSSLIREAASLGADISSFVPASVTKYFEQKLKR